jgi:pimeloyl-ACP methyl ester carboxylesterase
MPSRRRVAFLATIGALGAVWSYSRRVVRRWEDLELAEVEKPGRLIRVGDVELHYVDAGEGPALLLLHGIGASTFSFRRLIPHLAAHFRVLALDMKGFGFSERTAVGDYSLLAHARLARDFLDAVGIEQAFVLGHSLGGAVAMHLAVVFPERVRRLVLVSSASDRETRRGIRGARLLRPFLPVVAAFTLRNRWFRRMSLRSACYDPAYVTPEVMEGYLAPTHIRGHLRSLGNLLVDRRNDPPLDPSTIRQPTLIIWGEGDRWLPPSRGRQLQGLIPDSRLLIIERAGHLVPEEQPDEAAHAIIDFLQEEAADQQPPVEGGRKAKRSDRI